MSIEVVRLGPEHERAWDEFCAGAVNATLLHTRRFLSYHGDRFKDRSLLVLEKGKLAGVFPAAESPFDPSMVISHPGATYGGVVHQGRLFGTRMIDVLSAINEHYAKACGYRRLQYRSVPHIYAQMPAQDDSYALFRLGAKRVRCDLSCTIDLANRAAVSERRKRGIKKSAKTVEVKRDVSFLPDLWGVIAENLARKYAAKPVHSLSELTLLRGRFPHEIVIRSALIGGKVEAGVVFFNSPPAWHAQYIAASEAAYEVSALDAVFDAAIGDAKTGGARYFDFGTSNEEAGLLLNDGLYRFKSEFGGGGTPHEHYELELT